MAEILSLILPLVNLGAAVVITIAFLFFLYKKEERYEVLAKTWAEQLASVEKNYLEHNKILVNDFSQRAGEQFEKTHAVLVQNAIVIGKLTEVVQSLPDNLRKSRQ